MTARVKTSTVMRTFEERVILKAHQEQTVVLELQVQQAFSPARLLTEIAWQDSACQTARRRFMSHFSLVRAVSVRRMRQKTLSIDFDETFLLKQTDGVS